MERSTSAELLSTIDTQKEQLQRYESRLRDVVRAYKGLQKEKEALESSVRVLSQGSKQTSDCDQPPDTEEQDNRVSGEDEREKLHTLSASLATLTEEKARLEASLIADKKKLLTENEDLQKAVEKERLERQRDKDYILSQLTEAKSKLRSHQLDREAEQTNHGIMLKELQLVLAEERASKEILETQLESAQQLEGEKQSGCEEEVYKQRIQELSLELDKVRGELHKWGNTASDQQTPLLLELQRDMEEMKKNYQHQLSAETERANDAKRRLDVCAKQAEERICGLESKISEISSIIGSYDQMLVKDKDVIRKLKERVSQLDSENAVLATSVSISPSATLDVNMDSQTIAEKILHLKDLLLTANDKCEHPVNVTELLTGEKSDQCYPQCAKYKEELESTKEEFERYKLRVQSVLKNKNKETCNKEVEGLRDQVRQLRERIRQLQQERCDSAESQQLEVEHVTRSMQAATEKHRQDLAAVRAHCDKQVKDMELELKRQRERTINLLSEKDREIQSLKCSTGQNVEVEYLSEMPVASEGASSDVADMEHSTISRLFESRGGMSGQGETVLLHYAQERARWAVEVSALRRQKRELETALREVQHSSSLRQETLTRENDNLKEEVWKQQRNVTRENANLEYLKNVIYNFLTSSNRGGRRQMLKAIMTILQFSPKEVDRVNSCAFI